MKRTVLLIALIIATPLFAQRRVASLVTMAKGSVPAESYARRAQAITISADQISAIVRAGISDDGKDFTFQLFADVTLTVTLFPPSVAESGRTVLTGRVKDQRDSSLVLAIRDGEMFGNIRVGTACYQLRSSGETAAVYDMNLGAFAKESEPVAELRGTAMPVSNATVVTTATGPVEIDVMVLYTTKARTEVGGESFIKTMIDGAIYEANIAYEASGVNQRLRLVRTAEVAYDEDNLGTEPADKMFTLALSRLAGTADGFMDDIHEMRSAHNADLVSLIIKRTSVSCGIGRLGTPPRDTSGFSVADRVCAATNLTFAHELGHNMGLMHDRANSDSNGLTSYAYGYQEPAGEFRTIMAYSDGCAGFCPRIPRFSNPDVKYNGKPTGVASDQTNSANAARTLNESALMVANLRGQTTPSGLVASDHATASGYDSDAGQPTGRTATFKATDASVFAWLRVSNVTGVHSVQRKWTSPDGSIYTMSTPATVTGDGTTKNFSGNIGIAGTAAATRLGTWTVSYLIDNAVVSTDSFTINDGSVQPSSCVANTNTLCLQGNRFAVTITGTFNGTTAPGQAVSINNQFGYFSIPALTFDPSNAEVLVKIAGPVTGGHYWVFYGGISGFEINVTVKDMQTGVTKTYNKPVNTYNGGADFNSF